MEKDEQLNCSICCSIARDAVCCKQKRCHKLFCQNCQLVISKEGKKENRSILCPFCRTDPFECVPSPLREKINNLKLKCRHCKKEVKLTDIDNHQRVSCQEKVIKCKFCNGDFKKKDIVKHTNSYHGEKITEIIQGHHESKTPIPNPDQVIKRYGGKIVGKIPTLGKTGKFYCEGPLGLVCTCCNGKCGPSNGENCVRCMTLDMHRKGLSSGYLVNGGGSVCWKDKYDRFSCRSMFSQARNHCGINQQYCRFCQNLNKTQQRYSALM